MARRPWTWIVAAIAICSTAALAGDRAAARPAATVRPAHSLQWVCDHLHAGPVEIIRTLPPKYQIEQGACGQWLVLTFATTRNRDDWARAVRALLGPDVRTVIGPGWGAQTEQG